MTAKVQRHEVDGYKAIGAAGVITKPFDAKSLPDSIMSILEAWKNKDVLSCA
jgi:two-component system, OmpR family, response regulator